MNGLVLIILGFLPDCLVSVPFSSSNITIFGHGKSNEATTTLTHYSKAYSLLPNTTKHIEILKIIQRLSADRNVRRKIKLNVLTHFFFLFET